MMQDVLRVCTEFGGKKEQKEILEGAEFRHVSSSCLGSIGLLCFSRGTAGSLEQFLNRQVSLSN